MPVFPSRTIPLSQVPLLFIDLEMTGLDHRVHEIVEIAALKVMPPDFAIVNQFYTKVTPTHLISADPASLKLINFSPSDWTDAIPLHQALVELAAFCPDCMLAGWSIQNEWDFLLAALDQEKLPHFFNNYLIEVSTLVYAKYHADPNLLRLGLSSACKFLGVTLDQHKPDSDIKATYEIFKKLLAS